MYLILLPNCYSWTLLHVSEYGQSDGVFLILDKCMTNKNRGVPVCSFCS